MRLLPTAIPVLIAIIVLDLAIVFGTSAHRIMTSPIYGLDQLAFANLVYGIGGMFGWKAQGLYGLAAFFGAVYLTIAAVFVLHLASRVWALRGGTVSHDLLDAGMILVVVSTILAATPAILQGASDILVQERLPLWLVGLAATLSMVERLPDSETHAGGFAARLWGRLTGRLRGRRAAAPVVPDRMAAGRWNSLRSTAGMAAKPAPAEKPAGSWYMLRLR